MAVNLQNQSLAITGVGGFIGLRTAERALERGMRVQGLEVSEAAASRARAAGVKVEVGDVCDPAVVARALEGAQVVFHTAAILSEGNDWTGIRKVNVEGTRVVARAARDAGATRLVHLSSVMVHGFSFPDGVAEDGPLCGENNPYCQTKIESEEVVRSFHQKGKLEVIIIRPGDVYGPGSAPWVTRPLELMKRGQFAIAGRGDGVINHVYVDNLVDAVFLALEKDATGEAFTVTDGVATTWTEYWELLARTGGQRPPRHLPERLLRGAAWTMDKVFTAARRPSPLTPASLSFIMRPHAYSIAKARRVLGYEPRVGLDEGMRRVGEWLASR